MNFTLTNGELHITATTGTEIAELCKHFNLKVEDHVDDLIAGTMSYASRSIKRPWFAVTADVPFIFLKPYYDLLAKVTGYDGPPFDIVDERLRYPGGYCKNLCHTHIVTTARIGADGYHADGFIASEDWDGKKAADRAPYHFNEYCRAALGATKSEPEYIEMNNGLLRRNPNYMKTHAPHPQVTSERLFETIFQRWLDNVATLAQQVAYVEGDQCHHTVCKDSLAASFLRGYNNGFHINKYADLITFEQFKELGNA